MNGNIILLNQVQVGVYLQVRSVRVIWAGLKTRPYRLSMMI